MRSLDSKNQMSRNVIRSGSLKRRARHNRPCRPMIEAFEDRVLLTTQATLVPGPVINVSQQAGSQSEPAIAINPFDPGNVVVRSNQNVFGVNGEFLGVTFDGHNFQTRGFADGTDGLPESCCDPSMQFDEFGNLWATYLGADLESIFVAVSTDGGATFQLVETLTQNDAVDQPTIVTGPGSVWVTYRSFATATDGIVAAGISVDGLGSFGTFSPLQLAPGSVSGNFGDITIGPEGQVLVTYMDPAGGTGPANIQIHIDPDGLGPAGFGPAIFSQSINVGGFTPVPPQPVRTVDAALGLFYDRSGGQFDGRAYLLYTDRPDSTSVDTDVFLRFSDDDGASFSAPIQVNDDTGTNSQFFPRMAVDQTTGNLAFAWYDARLDEGAGGIGDTDGAPNTEAHFFATASRDGGQTFLPNIRLSDGPSSAERANNNFGNDYGDYSALDFVNGTFWASWVDNSIGLIGNPNPDLFEIAAASVDLIEMSVDIDIIETEFLGLFEDQPLQNATVGVLTDLDPTLGEITEYTATIDWGDGSLPEPLGLEFNETGGIDLIGTHTYVEGGSFTVSITADRNGILPSTETFDFQVGSFPIVADTSGITLATRENLQLTEVVVGSFEDFDPGFNPTSNYDATIQWGDGTVSLGTVVERPDGTFNVIGTHTYLEGGDFIYEVTVTEEGGETSSAMGEALIESEPIIAQSSTIGGIDAVEGVPFLGEVARFVDLDQTAFDINNYQAVIDWGDGTSSDGVISLDPLGEFVVSGEHLFSIGPDGENDLPVSITITEGGGNTAEVTTTANVTDAEIEAQALVVEVTEGPFEGVVASFTDQNPLGTIDQFSAFIEIEGNVVPGTITQDEESGVFQVVGDLEDLEVGSFPVTVTVISTGGSDDQVTSTLLVADAPIDATPFPISSVEGFFEGAVASFTDRNPDGVSSDFTATISWGDGTVSEGTVVQTEGGAFEVLGTNLYEQGTFDVVVTITGDGENTTDVTGTATIQDAPITVIGVPVQTLEIATVNLTVGALFDSNPAGMSDDLTVMINWGDGETTLGAAVRDPNGSGFFVQGEHQYIQSGTFPVTATITSIGGQTDTIETTATVSTLVVPVMGRLAPGSDSVIIGDGLTNDTSPTVEGFAIPTSTVILFGQGSDGVLFLLDEVPTNPIDGGFEFTTSPLPDGTFSIIAASKNLSGIQSSPLVTLVDDLLIDTQTPEVTDVFLDSNRGELIVSFDDNASGILAESLLNPALYSLVGPNGSVVPITGAQIGTPRTALGQSVILQLAGGGPIANGSYTVAVNGEGILDSAGNSVTESFFTQFPQFNTVAQSLFLAEIIANNGMSTRPMQVIPADQRAGRDAFLLFIQGAFRVRPNQ